MEAAGASREEGPSRTESPSQVSTDSRARDAAASPDRAPSDRAPSDEAACRAQAMTVYRMLDGPAIHTDTTYAARALQYVDELKACVQRGDLPNDDDRMTHWLLINEVYVLDKLGRLKEGRMLVDAFFDEHAVRADTTMLAKMHMWRSYFLRHQGRFVERIAAFHDAMQFINKLDPVRQAHLLLNGAVAYRHAGNPDRARSYIQQADQLLADIRALIDTSRIDYREAAARSLHLSALLALDESPDEAREKLSKIFQLVPERYQASPHVSMAVAFVRDGNDKEAQRHFASAERIVETYQDTRNYIRLLYERGRYYSQIADREAATRNLKLGLRMARQSGINEFDVRLTYELGQLHESAGAAEALAYYREALMDSADPGNAQNAEAQQLAQAAVLHMIEARTGWWVLDFGPWGTILVAVLGAAGMLMTVRSMYTRSRDDELGVSLAFTEETSPPPPFGPISRYHHVTRFMPLPGEQRNGAAASDTLDAGANLSEVAPSPQPSEHTEERQAAEEHGTIEDASSPYAVDHSASGSQTSSKDDAPAVCVWDEIAREVAARENFEEFPLHLKDVVDTLDKESWDILTQCRLYVDTYTRVGIDTDFRQAQLKEEEHRIFRAVMQWLLEDDVWSWMEQVKRDREKKNASREESTS